MSLIDAYMTEFVLLEKMREPDGEGGWVTSWRDGMTFSAAVTTDSTMQARIAEAQGVKSVYTVTTRRNTLLDFHDVIKRLSDGAIFRITSDSSERQTPSVSTLDIAQAMAERWELT